MPFVNRFFLNSNGAITYTGNTLGLSRSDTVGVPGTVDSIGAFVTIDTSQTFGAYPPGTTGDYTLDSSSAILQLPLGSTVLYAELIWGGMYINQGVDLSAFIDNSVSFTTPSGVFSIAPDPATNFEVLLSNAPPFDPAYAYVRSADVTPLIQAAGAGTYTTGGVVGTIVVPDPTSNHAMWTLAVVYSNASLPLRNLSIRVGADVILATSGPVDTLVTGFATPFMGPLDGRALISAQEGDANKTGDMALFGPDAGTLTALSGPNNLTNNFFASQVNDDAGMLDISGTFGTRNQINGNPGSNIIGGRQGYDVTNVSIAGTLLNAQTSAVFRLTTNGDGYLVDSIGLQIDIQTPVISIIKSTPATDAIVGDIITYTLAVENTGDVDTTDVQVTDSIDETSSVFVPGSVTLNGVPVPGADPDTGITVGTLTPGDVAFITFQYQVTAVPFGGTLDDQGRAAYTYQLTPDSPIISTFVPSNIIQIPVYQPIVGLVKSADMSTAFIGDTVTYTLIASNTGNISIMNAVITDPLPAGSSFVAGSVTVGGVSVPAANPVTGISVGTIGINSSVTVTFQVLVTANPPGGNLVNQSTISYTYQPPDGRIIIGSTPSNQVVIPIVTPPDSPDVQIIKVGSPNSGIVGDIITYSITATNNSIAAVFNAVLTDIIPGSFSFVPASVTINGVPSPAADPAAGIPLGTLLIGQSVTVAFQVQIVSVPAQPVVLNQASLTYDFIGNPVTTPSTPGGVTVLQPVIGLLKRASVTVASVGDTVNYSVTVTNTGNLAANVTLTDPLNAFSSFVPGTVRINGTLTPAANPGAGIPLGSIAPGGSVLVSYDVLLTSSPPSGFFDNQASAAFTFQSPSGAMGSGSSLSNIVRIAETSPLLNVVKSASEPFGLVGDIVTYTVTITNASAGAVMNVVATDNSTPGTAFVPGSLTIDGVPSAGNIKVGVSLGTLNPGQVIVLTYQEQILALPAPSYDVDDIVTVTFTQNGVPLTSLSNVVAVTVFIPSAIATKSAREPFAFVGDEIHYQVTITNTGNLNAGVTWDDMLPEGTVFVENSLRLNGVPVPGVNMYTGAFIGTVEAQSTAIVTYKLKVVSYPPSGQVVNQAQLSLVYTLPNGRTFTDVIMTNPVTVPILTLALLTKIASSSSVVVGSTIAFELTVFNPNVNPIANVIVRDDLPNGLSFVPGSLSLNGTPLPNTTGLDNIPIGTIPAQGTATLRFLAKAIFAPANPVVVNTATVSYDLLLPDGSRISRIGVSNPVRVVIEEHEE
ncbi:conserved repeat domain-containing protein [Paenibacillaceae bacterium GAS479]|nr:conserved repeat domain-containing protein [Paenibacillaceae bacterium GAS479]